MSHPVSRFFDYEQEGDRPPGPDVGAAPVFLDGIDRRSWQAFRSATELHTFAPGATLLARGDEDRALLVIVTGTAEAVVPGSRRSVSVPVPAGSVVGEVAFLDGRPRSAEVRALGDVTVLRLSWAAFERLADREPALGHRVLLDLGVLLAHRLRLSESRWA